MSVQLAKNEIMKQPTQRDLQAENRRNQLLDLALALYADRGVENVSIKDLATEAQVAQGLIYYYFQSKDALLEAVFQRHNSFPPYTGDHQENCWYARARRVAAIHTTWPG